MNREIQVAVGIVTGVVGILSDNDSPDDDWEVDRIVMQLATEKVKDVVERER